MNASIIIPEVGPVVGELTREHFRRDVLAGLAQSAKTLPCKYFYDDEGARLFEALCELEEYYPTRTEISILRRNIGEIAALTGPCCRLVELGSGSGVKTELLLDHLDHPAVYIPIDVARAQLQDCSVRLAREHPGIEVRPLCTDYTSLVELPDISATAGRTLVFFPGSTVGNLEPADAANFLRRMAALCGEDGGLLLGVDLKKDPAMLNAAYNDARGLTAEFNLNLLARANRELDAGFDCAQFRHYAFYNDPAGRIEMHLISRAWQTVPVAGVQFSFRAGESILTEHSYKYTPEEFRRLAAQAGLKVLRSWTDDRNWFSVQYLVGTDL